MGLDASREPAIMPRVGRRSASASVVAVLVAFLEQRTWSQSDLARHISISVPAVRRVLEELRAAGVPLERDEDHPHVYWNIARDWVPGGVALEGRDVRAAVRLLSRLPKSSPRERLLARLLKVIPDTPRIPEMSREQPKEAVLEAIEDAAAQRVPLRFDYHSASTGEHALRVASVHQVDYGPPARFFATCHRDGVLKTFRLDGVTAVYPPNSEVFRERDDDEVARVAREAIDGFIADGPLVTCRFRVDAAIAQWVRRNLPTGTIHISQLKDGGILAETRTRSVAVLARFVVGLGNLAHAETPELADAVYSLARGALHE
jgi:predicted DNA-binding transcriptional regulator YafY